MKHGLLVYRINRDDPANTGVIKKCLAQRDAFKENGFEVDMLWLSKEGVLLNDTLIAPMQIPPHSLLVYWYYFFGFGNTIKDVVSDHRYDFIYLRHPFFDPQLDRSLRTIKRYYPELKILLEINTFPYDAEPKRWLHKLSLRMDQYFRKNAHEYVDRIIDYGQQEKIWDIPCINIRNGISTAEVPAKNSNPGNEKIRLIALGNWSYWHGLDRLIHGFREYTGPQSLELRIVGNGPEKSKLQNLVNQLDLQEEIQFLPATYGKDLDRLFDSAEIGVGTLGLHRKDVQLDSSLKHREYCSRGLPFFLSAPDMDFPNQLDFICYLPPNDDPVDLARVVDWYTTLPTNLKIREYAERHLSWEAQLQPVFTYLRS